MSPSHPLQDADERAHAAEARSSELYDCTQRLEAHIADLESRKRAPLYQKRQEAELQVGGGNNAD